MAEALINPAILSWARLRAGVETAELARKLGVTDRTIEFWENGGRKPTFRQAEMFAECTHIPFGYLYLSTPPSDEIHVPDLRRFGGRKSAKLSIDLIDTIEQVTSRQEWYRKFLLQQNASTIEAVGRMPVAATAPALALDIREELNLPPDFKPSSSAHYLTRLVERIENLGILVMRSSVAGDDARRSLNAEEFSGFSLADPIAPVIFVNAADRPGTQVFALIQGLALIWFGKSGISDFDLDTEHDLVKKCNAVAAEFLAPDEQFLQLWGSMSEDSMVRLSRISRIFYVSRWIIARRALELNLVSAEFYDNLTEELSFGCSNPRVDRPFNELQTARVSRRLAAAVASETLSGRLFYRDAWDLIGIKANNFEEFARNELKI